MVMENQTTRGKIRDPRWLRIEVCRDHMRDEVCERGEEQCRFAHPDKNCLIVSGKVTACYDSMKGRCSRDNCKYYHPPDHLKKYIQALGKAFEQQRLAEEQSGGYAAGHMPLHFPIHGANALYQLGQNPGQLPPRRPDFSDKLPICCFFVNKTCKKTEDDCQFAHPPPSVDVDPNGFVTVCMDSISDRCDRENCRYFHPPSHLKARVKAMQMRHVPLSPAPQAEGVTMVSEPAPQTNFVPMITSTTPLMFPQSTMPTYAQGTTPMFLYNMQTPMGSVTFPTYAPMFLNNPQVPNMMPLAH